MTPSEVFLVLREWGCASRSPIRVFVRTSFLSDADALEAEADRTTRST